MRRRTKKPRYALFVAVGFMAGAVLVGGGTALVARGQIDRLEIGIAGLAHVIVATNSVKR